MMYSNKVAVALKHNSKVLRDTDGIVKLPFGSEYSILIKNLNSVRALVTVTIDGTDAGDGRQFVINANDDLELERFLKNGNMNEGNRFKFIERTDSIEEHRGVGIEDGLVRIEFQFEKPQPSITWYNYRYDSGMWRDNGYKGSMRSMRSIYSAEVQANDAGITVPGSISDQKFHTVASFFPVEYQTHNIVLRMLGETEDNRQVKKPVTVKTKPKCTTCGRTNKATAKFCTNCGTSLTIV